MTNDAQVRLEQSAIWLYSFVGTAHGGEPCAGRRISGGATQYPMWSYLFPYGECDYRYLGGG